MFRQLLKGFADVVSHKPKGIPKVTDKMVWIYLIDPDGQKHAIAGMEGESMLRVLEQAKIDIPGYCRGGDALIPETEDPVDPLRSGPTCSECQIEVAEPWVNYLKPMGIWEKDRLIKSDTGFFTPQSRLACCFTVEKWMNGMQIIIPYNSEQKMEFDNYEYEQGINKAFRL